MNTGSVDIADNPGRPPAQPRRPRLSVLAAIMVGVISIGSAIAVGELLAVFVGPTSSPLLAVNEEIVNLTQARFKEFAVDTLGLGTNDKTVLMISVAVALLIFGVVAGLLSRRRAAPGVVLAVLLVGAVGAAFASASYAVALLTGTEEGMASVTNSLAVPLLLLSGILLPMTLAPGWLRTVSNANPVKHIVDALRALFQGHVMTGTVGIGVLVGLGLIAIGMLFGTRTFQRDSA